jgi:hypothetical protein
LSHWFFFSFSSSFSSFFIFVSCTSITFSHSLSSFSRSIILFCNCSSRAVWLDRVFSKRSIVVEGNSPSGLF